MFHGSSKRNHFIGGSVLEVLDVTVGYGDTTVLRNVSVSVPAGSVVALLGPNGAGKTTLLRTISGGLNPRSGRISLEGHDITRRPAYQRSRMGLCHIPEGRGIFGSLSVRDNLVLHSPKGKESESIERATQIFPILGRRLNQSAGSMSGGEQQMLALVRAYLREPKLVLVDEASMGLAPLIVDQIFEFLADIAAKGSALLVVEQYVTRALDLAQTAYILTRGQVVFQGPAATTSADEVFEKYLGIDTATGARG
jgi:branched-chain amino acid transport system ATP-binding protein